MAQTPGEPIDDYADEAENKEPAPFDPAAPERVADRLLQSLRDRSPIALFDWAETDALAAPAGDASLSAGKIAADLLVKAKLARFDDEQRTEVAITNAGRYWAASGGYLAFLKEEPSGGGGGGGRQRNPEMEALRSEYMKLRLNTFWYSFGLSIAGFVMSLISIAIALLYGDRLLR